MGEKQIVRGALLSYYAHPGEGMPFVFLHGVGSNYTIWKKLFRNRRCVALDLRGHGKSGAGSASIATLLLDIKTVMDHERIDKAILVGTSFGALLAKRFADRFQKRVHALVLLSPYGGDLARCSSVLWLLSVFLHRLFCLIPLLRKRRFQDYSQWKPVFFPLLDIRGVSWADLFATSRLMLKSISLHELKHNSWVLYGKYDPLLCKSRLFRASRINSNIALIQIGTHHHIVSNHPDAVWSILEAI